MSFSNLDVASGELTEADLKLTVIRLWEHGAECRRCTNETLSRFGWPYYEEFIIGAGEPWQERGAYVTVCCCCYLELLNQEANS